LPPYVREALQKLNDAGHVAYVVGGSVRDFLLNRESKDHDIATSATPDQICELFPKSVTVGKAFGVIKVPTGTEPPLLEIATFREDQEYQNHRHPTSVVFSGPYQDAQRRDFTINGLFYDPKTGRILDSVGGGDDLQSKVIRAIGNPSERFKEDALRLLRAVRFSTRFGFQIEPATATAIHARARLITKVSAERIRDELNGMWTGPRPAQSLQLLAELGLLDLILPEVESLKGVPQIPATRPQEDVWSHVLRVLDHLAAQNPKRSSVVCWAAILHEVGKPIASRLNGGKNFNGHELEGAKLVERITNRLKMSRLEINQIVALVSDHLKFKDVFQMRESTLQRWIRQPYFEDLLALHRADATASDGNLAYYEFCAHRYETFKKAPSIEIQKLVDGKDLIQMGFSPGPEFSEILRVVEDLALEKKLSSKEEALEYVVKNFVK
jgi:poly(A) polymerase